METIPVVIIGLGPIGRLCAEIAMDRSDIQIAGAADINPELVGRDLADILGRGPNGLTVRDRIETALDDAGKGVAVLTTSSQMDRVADQIMVCLDKGFGVVTTCEEMGYPFITQPELSARIDQAAVSAGQAVLGTGVNPGFAMDALPVFLSGVMRRVESVVVERFQDASLRRKPFQEKIGAGLTLEEFRDKTAAGIIRHVGFRESIDFIASAWGINLEKVEEQVRPVMATSHLQSPFRSVPPGRVAGLDQIAQGFYKGRAVITLNLQAYFGHPHPKERIRVKGDPDLELLVPGGIAGDTATCAITVNAIPRVLTAKPGLRTMLDVGLPAGNATGP